MTENTITKVKHECRKIINRLQPRPTLLAVLASVTGAFLAYKYPDGLFSLFYPFHLPVFFVLNLIVLIELLHYASGYNSPFTGEDNA